MSKQEILDAPVKLAEYSAVEAGLSALRNDLDGVIFDVTTTEGNKAARAARQRCVSIRTSADAAYSDWNKPMLEKQRDMRAKLAEIKGAVKEVEEPIDDQIKEHDRIKAEEKAERERIEAERRKAIDERVWMLGQFAVQSVGLSSAKIAAMIETLQAEEITLDEYGDRAGEAEIAKRNALDKLEEMHAAAVAHEAEQEKIKAERAELERQRKQQAKEAAEAKAKADAEHAKQQAELKRQREEQVEKDAAAKAKADAEAAERRAEHDKQQAYLKAQQDAIDRQKQEIADAQKAADLKEQQRLDAIEAEAQAKRDAEAKAAREKAEAEAAAEKKKADDEAQENARRERVQFEKNGPGDAAIIETLALHYRAHESAVIAWLVAMDLDAASKEMMKEFA